jgi:hypothetical protein
MREFRRSAASACSPSTGWRTLGGQLAGISPRAMARLDAALQAMTTDDIFPSRWVRK